MVVMMVVVVEVMMMMMMMMMMMLLRQDPLAARLMGPSYDDPSEAANVACSVQFNPTQVRTFERWLVSTPLNPHCDHMCECARGGR
jgi:hypothetical protein